MRIRSHWHRVGWIVAAFVFGSGCAPDGTAAHAASLSGDMGHVTGFATHAASIRADSTNVRIDATADVSSSWSGWAMTSLTFWTPMSDPAWAPGTRYDSSIPSDSSHEVSALGCSGPSYEDYTFDSAPRRVQIRVDAGPTPTSRLFTFTCEWTNGNGRTQTVTGSYVYDTASVSADGGA